MQGVPRPIVNHRPNQTLEHILSTCKATDACMQGHDPCKPCVTTSPSRGLATQANAHSNFQRARSLSLSKDGNSPSCYCCAPPHSRCSWRGQWCRSSPAPVQSSKLQPLIAKAVLHMTTRGRGCPPMVAGVSPSTATAVAASLKEGCVPQPTALGGVEGWGHASCLTIGLG